MSTEQPKPPQAAPRPGERGTTQPPPPSAAERLDADAPGGERLAPKVVAVVGLFILSFWLGVLGLLVSELFGTDICAEAALDEECLDLSGTERTLKQIAAVPALLATLVTGALALRYVLTGRIGRGIWIALAVTLLASGVAILVGY